MARRALFIGNSDGGWEDIDEEFKDLVNKKEKSPKFDRLEFKDKTRSKIANMFIWGFFLSIGVSFVAILIYNSYVLSHYCLDKNSCDYVLEIKDILVAIMGYIGTPLGFVIGYYFKDAESEDSR